MRQFMLSVDDAPREQLGGQTIAGKVIEGQAAAALTTVGVGCMLVRLDMEEGFDQNGHTHHEHESYGYVLSGRIKMRIGDETHILTSGSTWLHPKGVEHTTLALEDSVALEFHAPLRDDLLKLFGETGQDK